MAAVQNPPRGGPAPGQSQPRPPAPRTPSVRPVVDRGRGRFAAGVTIGQVVAWQVAAAAALVGLVREDWLRFVGFGVAAAVAVPALLPVGRRWCYQWFAVQMRFWWRVPSAQDDTSADPRLLPLRELLPDLDVAATQGRFGEQFGIVQDGQAWVAVVEVQRADGLLPPPRQSAPPRLPLRQISDVLAVDDVRLAAVQVVVHTVPAPSGLLPGRVNAASSYQQLTGGQVPASQVVWIALRLDPGRCPDAIAARGGGEAGIHRALRRCIARAVEVLESAGITARGLDADEVRSALSLSAGVAPRQAPTGARHTGEEWRRWSCDGINHVTYWLGRWPPDPARGLSAVVDRLGAVPALFTTASLTFCERNLDRVQFRGMIRVSGTSAEAVERASSGFESLASAAGFRPVRLDGEQAPAALATMPLGGGAP